MPDNDALTLRSTSRRARAGAGFEAVRGTGARVLGRATDAVVVGGGWVLFPLWPLLAAIILREATFLAWYRNPRRMSNHIRAVWRTRAISRAIVRRLTPRPKAGQITGRCTHCGQCCLDKSCVFLIIDRQGQSRCRIYGRWIWRTMFANCARYPIDAEEIDLYRCPGFTASPSAGGHRVALIGHARPRKNREANQSSD